MIPLDQLEDNSDVRPITPNPKIFISVERLGDKHYYLVVMNDRFAMSERTLLHTLDEVGDSIREHLRYLDPMKEIEDAEKLLEPDPTKNN